RKELWGLESERGKETSGSGEPLSPLVQAIARAASQLPDAETRFSLSRFATSLLPKGNGEVPFLFVPSWR
ncbi:MAG: hypothetical protein ACO2PL_19635, partial [Armatimonadota bacterium]